MLPFKKRKIDDNNTSETDIISLVEARKKYNNIQIGFPINPVFFTSSDTKLNTIVYFINNRYNISINISNIKFRTRINNTIFRGRTEIYLFEKYDISDDINTTIDKINNSKILFTMQKFNGIQYDMLFIISNATLFNLICDIRTPINDLTESLVTLTKHIYNICNFIDPYVEYFFPVVVIFYGKLFSQYDNILNKCANKESDDEMCTFYTDSVKNMFGKDIAEKVFKLFEINHSDVDITKTFIKNEMIKQYFPGGNFITSGKIQLSSFGKLSDVIFVENLFLNNFITDVFENQHMEKYYKLKNMYNTNDVVIEFLKILVN